MTAELRKTWVCANPSCAVRVFYADGQEHPLPAKWEVGEDGSLCPKCNGNGKTADQIAHGEAVRKGQTKNAGPSKKVAERRAKVADMLEAEPDLLNEELGKRLGASATTIRNDRIETGFPPQAPQPSHPSSDRKRELVEQRIGEGLGDNEVAMKTGIAIAAVAGIRAELSAVPA
jgi:hypothetical protein